MVAEWVSVNDHMPEDDERYKGMWKIPVWSFDDHSGTYHYCWRWKIDGVWKWCPAYRNHRITQWFGLPEPPRGFKLVGQMTIETERT